MGLLCSKGAAALRRTFVIAIAALAMPLLSFYVAIYLKGGTSGNHSSSDKPRPADGGSEAGQSYVPEPPGWFAGDPHVHRGILCARSDAKEMLTPEELLAGMKAQNLAVISVLGDIGNGEVKQAEKDLLLVNGEDHPASTSQRIVHWDAEWHYDPAGVTFEQKVIGGHLILLGLRHAEKIFAEYTYPVFAWAKKQNAIVGFAHLQYLRDDIPKDLDCCLPLEYPVEIALGTSAFLMEDVNGGDSAVQAYYRLLNCGFRPGLAAGTDYPCNNLEPFGTLLTYVAVGGGKLSYRRWIEGIAEGRTVVSRNGHHEFLDLRVNETARPGDDVRLNGKGTVRVRIGWFATRQLTGRIELVRNGIVVASREGSASPGSPLVFETSQNFLRSGWLCARRMDAKGHQSHTGAVFVTVDSAPVRASVSDAEYFVRFIDNLLRKTSPGGEWAKFFSQDRVAARSRYRRAREVFQGIAVEAKRQEQE
jgi:hypothetical protein